MDPGSRYRAVVSGGVIRTGETVVLEVEDKAPLTVPGSNNELLTLDFDTESYVVNIKRMTTGPALRFAAPTGHDFGRQKLNTAGTDSITIHNDGNEPSTVSAVTATNASFVVASALPLTIPAGGSLGLPVSFAPKTHVTAHSAELAITATDCGGGLPRLTVTGSAFGRARSIWGVGAAPTVSQPRPGVLDDSFCLELDDHTLTCEGQVVGSNTLGRTLVRHALSGRACTLDGAAQLAQCRMPPSGALEPPPLMDGVVRAHPHGPRFDPFPTEGLLSDGRVLTTLSPRVLQPQLTGIAQLEDSGTGACVRRFAGSLACWGFGLAPAFKSGAGPDEVVTLPGLVNAVDFATRDDSTLLVLRGDGSAISYQRGIPFVGPYLLAGPGEAKRVIGSPALRPWFLCVLRTNGTVACLFDDVATMTDLGVNDVVDLADTGTYPRLAAVLFDGRVMRGRPVRPLEPWVAQPGFD
ncbi:MAG: hypothetical protein IPG50_32430 [Myxococcales bacterium]|nr:hypothetical protein [Myxococcales bacterium]